MASLLVRNFQELEKWFNGHESGCAGRGTKPFSLTDAKDSGGEFGNSGRYDPPEKVDERTLGGFDSTPGVNEC